MIKVDDPRVLALCRQLLMNVPAGANALRAMPSKRMSSKDSILAFSYYETSMHDSLHQGALQENVMRAVHPATCFWSACYAYTQSDSWRVRSVCVCMDGWMCACLPVHQAASSTCMDGPAASITPATSSTCSTDHVTAVDTQRSAHHSTHMPETLSTMHLDLPLYACTAYRNGSCMQFGACVLDQYEFQRHLLACCMHPALAALQLMASGSQDCRITAPAFKGNPSGFVLGSEKHSSSSGQI